MAGIGGGGGKIPGHSGTDFKHRKAFGGTKAFYKKWQIYNKHKLARSSQSFEEIRRARQHQKNVEIKSLLYLMAIIVSLTIVALWCFENYYPVYVVKSSEYRYNRYEQLYFDKKMEEKENEYHSLVKSGNRFFKEKKLIQSQRAYRKAIRLFPSRIKATEGMKNVLEQRCKTDNKYCDEASGSSRKYATV